MAVTRVQHVTQAASEGLSAKFCDLCDPHDLTSIRASKRTISKLTAKSRASSKALRQLRNQERRVLASSSMDDDAFLMSFIPLKTEPSLYRMRRSFSVSKLGSPATTADFHMACNSPRKTGQGVTKKLLRLCMGSNANKYTPLPVY